MTLTHSEANLSTPRRSKSRTPTRAKTASVASRANQPSPALPSDRGPIVMADPLRLEGKRSVVNQPLIYAVPGVIVLAAVGWLMLRGGSEMTAAPEPSASPAPAVISSGTSAGDAATATASTPAPVAARLRRAPTAPRAAAPPAVAAETAARDTSAVEPLPVDQLAASVANAPAELVAAPVPAPSPEGSTPTAQPAASGPMGTDTPIVQ